MYVFSAVRIMVLFIVGTIGLYTQSNWFLLVFNVYTHVLNEHLCFSERSL